MAAAVVGGFGGRAVRLSNAALLGITMFVSMIVPPAPETNRKIRVPNSRFARTPLPGSGLQTAPALDRQTAEKLPVGQPAVAAQHFGHLRTHGVGGVQAGHRFLRRLSTIFGFFPAGWK